LKALQRKCAALLTDRGFLQIHGIEINMDTLIMSVDLMGWDERGSDGIDGFKET
jgi:hypothetical protein